MVNPIEIQTLLKCCEIDENPFHTMLNRVKQLNMKQNQFEFKPFDQVLVRDDEQSIWKTGIYSHYEKESSLPYICVGSYYSQCIPYNEKTAHLLGTTKPYVPPQPKEYHVWNSGSFDEWMTEDEFQNFIKTAVINNKDITDFHVLRIK